MLEVKKITDPAFHKYGKVISGYDCSDLLEEMKKTPVPEGVIYVGSVPELEACASAKELSTRFFGGMPVQFGYCNGHNRYLNAVEYHRNCEVNIAVTDMIMMLGMLQDVEADFTYDTSKIEAFLVPAGTIVQTYETALHYAPCGVKGAGFQAIVLLPKGTNEELTEKLAPVGEDALLTHVNKWLIAHPDAKIAGAFCGLKGENVCVE